MGLDSHDPRTRLARFLKRQYPLDDGYQAKRLAEDLACTPKAAENILGGHWPQARHFARLVATFGRDLTDAVFHPDEAAERLEREVRELEETIAAKKAALRDVAGSPARMAKAVPADTRAAVVARPESRP